MLPEEIMSAVRRDNKFKVVDMEIRRRFESKRDEVIAAFSALSDLDKQMAVAYLIKLLGSKL